MEELKVKRKGTLNKILNNQLIVAGVTVCTAAFILMGTSYAVLGNKEETNDATVNIKIGSMQAVLSSASSSYVFTKEYQKPVSDAVGLRQNAYSFSLTNSGDSNIEYYEIRMVNQENKNSTLPHKYIRFAIQSNDNKYSDNINLGDVNSIVYSGYNLEKGSTINFNLKMWIDEKAPSSVYNKELYGALEVTLYQKYDAYSYYILYDTNNALNTPLRTSIQEPITSVIPERENYYFLGWSTEKDGSIVYNPGSTYQGEKGLMLYAVWKKIE